MRKFIKINIPNNMENTFPALALCFILSAAVTWLAGITLAKTTDTLDYRFKIGDALGGLILLGIGGSLPEIAVVFSAARDGHIPVIVGTLLGGIAIQTLIIVFFDFAQKGKNPLSYAAGSPMLSLEISFAIFLTILALAGTFVPPQKSFYGINPFSPIIACAWIMGIVFISRMRQHPGWNETAADAMPGRKHHERRAKQNHLFYAGKSTLHVILIFLAACIATLAAGIVLEKTGSAIAEETGINGGIFAAVFIALAAALPEISTGLESVFMGDNHLAVCDAMGGNAFMLVLFLFADLAAKKPVLSYAAEADFLIAAIGLLMMFVYAASFLFRWRGRHLRLGTDSILNIIIYFTGMYLAAYVIR